jgi:hypothetical protein
VGLTLSTKRPGPGMIGKVSHRDARAWQTLPVNSGSTVKVCRSYGAAPHQPEERCARQCFADSYGLSAPKKNLRARSSRFGNTADSPHVPRGITVPVGQSGGGSNLRFSSHGMARQACRKKSSWITTSG